MMCTGAILQSRIKKVVYGSGNEAFRYLSRIDAKIDSESGILEEKCKKIISDFFRKVRDKEGNDINEKA